MARVISKGCRAATLIAAAGVTAALLASTSRASDPATVPYVDPAWSPDGKKIAFVQRDQTAERIGALFTMRANGSGQTMLVPGMPDLGWPTWSPDGRRIAFGAKGAWIYVVNANGSGLRTLVRPDRDPGGGFYPDWSPGGRKIAYTATIGDTDAGNVIVMNPDGSRKTDAADSDGIATYKMPTWSPDGQRLAFRAVQAPDSANTVSPYLAYIHQYGGIVQGLDGTDANEPDWSPDGRTILYSTTPGQRPTIRRLNLRTGRTMFLHMGSHPRWSPDGRRVVFADNGQIYVMNADGSHVRQLTRLRASRSAPGSARDAPAALSVPHG